LQYFILFWFRERERGKKSLLKEKKKKKNPKAIPSLLRACLCTSELRRESYLFHATTPTDTIISNKGSFFFFLFHNFTYFLFHHFDFDFVKLLGFLWNWIFSSSISSVADLI
jgi:hypothetical protein